jgi:membrane protease YdiL (CAAX protease family)
MPRSSFPWRIFWLLLIAGVVSALAGLPYVLELLFSSDEIRQSLPLPLPLIAVLSVAQNGVVLAVAIALGLRLAERVGLQLPIIAAWASRERPVAVRPIVVHALALGVTVGMLVVVIEVAVFLPHLPPGLLELAGGSIPLWKRMLAGIFYGGILEELVCRLFLFSLFAWLLGFVLRANDGRPSATAFWMANLMVALLFGLGHLPATSALVPLTPVLVTRALVLNGLAGATCGYLFWRRGLEAAMLAHMAFHLVMQLPGVWLVRWLAPVP